MRLTNLYATDGVCHNANTGTYGHECGKPAVVIGVKNGFASGYCAHCRKHGTEARGVTEWVALEGTITIQDVERAK